MEILKQEGYNIMIDNCRSIKNIQLLTEVSKMANVEIVGTTPTLK